MSNVFSVKTENIAFSKKAVKTLVFAILFHVLWKGLRKFSASLFLRLDQDGKIFKIGPLA